jgi:hypothetical protein
LRKLFAIFLLLIYLFNLAGYAMLFNYLIERTETSLAKALDQQQYREEELLEIKVAMNLPYFSNETSYERVEGEILVNNIHYTYVKRKVANDTMYLKCLPNTAKSQLVKEKNRFGLAANDLPAGKKQQDSNVKKSAYQVDYSQTPDQYSFEIFSEHQAVSSTSNTALLADPFIPANDRPPAVS